MKNNNERISMLHNSRQNIIWGLIVLIFLGWTIVGGIFGIIMIIDGVNEKMKVKELGGNKE